MMPGPFTVDVVRVSPLAVVRVAGMLTDRAYRRVAVILDWLILGGGRDVTVYLDVPGGIDSAGLRTVDGSRYVSIASDSATIDCRKQGVQGAPA